MGRKPAIEMNEETLKIVRGAGAIHATHDEVSALLGCARSTWMEFKKNNPEAQSAYEDGLQEGKASLRRDQFKLAKRNAGMAIWLGKQYLGQRDVQYHREADWDSLTEAELEAEIEDALRELGVRASHTGKAGVAPKEAEPGRSRKN